MRSTRALVALCIFACVPGAMADEPYKLETIEVQGHYDNDVGTSEAASQGIVRGEITRDVPILRPGETLETVPGLVVTQHSGDGKANQYFLRGYNLDHGTDLSVSVDGVPVNMPTNAHGQGYADLNFLIPELIDRIDYRKGPYFADDGDFAAAGAVKIRLRDTLEHDFASLGIGSHGYRRALFAGSCGLTAEGCRSGTPAASPDGPRLLGALELTRQDGPWDLPEKLNKYSGVLRLSDGNGARGWSLDGIFYGAHWDSTDQVPLSLIQTGQLGRFQALDPTDGGDTGRYILSGEWHSVDDHGYVKASAFVERYRLNLWSNFTFFELRPATGDQFQQSEHRNVVGTQVSKGWNHTLWGLSSTTEIGLQVRHDNIDVGLFNTQARRVFETVSDSSVSETEAGLYGQNTTAWTPWMRTILGVRADRVDMSVTSHATSVNSGHEAAGKASPKFSAIFGPWNKTEVFANWGQGFHTNDARGVIDRVDPTTGGPSDRVPAIVGAEGKEIGLRTSVIEGLQSSVALWKLDSKSELVFAADSATGDTDANGASTRRGVEWNNHYVLGRHWLFDADLAWTRARYVNANDNGQAGDYIANAISRVYAVRVTMKDYGPWTFGLETLYFGEYPLTQDGSQKAPSATVTNLRLQNELSRKVTLSLDVLNVFDRKYFDIAYGQDYQVAPGAPVVPNGVTVHPGEPRQFRLTLRVNL
jgi:outer membrane receptor protein involved in Fe transport